MKEQGLEELKRKYESLRKKYNLPEFSKLNEDFEIERVAEKETDFVMRETRKVMMDKVLAYLRFVELLISPTNAPLFFLALVKGINGEEKKIFERIYERLGIMEIDVIELDNEYSEKAEAEFVKKTHAEWQEIKKSMQSVVEGLRRGWNQTSTKKDKNYLG